MGKFDWISNHGVFHILYNEFEFYIWLVLSLNDFEQCCTEKPINEPFLSTRANFPLEQYLMIIYFWRPPMTTGQRCSYSQLVYSQYFTKEKQSKVVAFKRTKKLSKTEKTHQDELPPININWKNFVPNQYLFLQRVNKINNALQ